MKTEVNTPTPIPAFAGPQKIVRKQSNTAIE